MTALIITFITAHLGVLLGLLTGAGGVLFGLFRHQQAKTATAQAAQVKAEAQQQVAAQQVAETQANADAQKAGSAAAVVRTDIDNQVAATPPSEVHDELQNWTRGS
ncbi:hypothetical protein [Paraburkholderia caballeronis]|uniref:hypothetical protein n=1 Tax=Paraburkholderia caballeronis TaxID=416943 RepID=UPI0010F003A2|nr:hypothetical protein [Paraburkholderia caballeronis]TDV06076.1 hypothetical protein C7408_12457 [Paraburkholderia caballeronis]TDV09616.1 hypothetical protein C7406_12657 [Paraburkholderia caballeronis]TDV21681.1 hypothetical protein C7404_12157 [Paraburkholderia caballeronis]